MCARDWLGIDGTLATMKKLTLLILSRNLTNISLNSASYLSQFHNVSKNLYPKFQMQHYN